MQFQNTDQNDFEIALVLGASVRQNSYPSDVLQKRLDKSIEGYQAGFIKKILVSGDNREASYDEPKVMKAYLVEHGIPARDIIQDFAGRRTLDSCWRAKNVFKLDKVVLITQPFHMPRSTFLCQQVGLQIKPMFAGDSRRIVSTSGVIREWPASWLALWEGFSGYEAPVKSDGTEAETVF
jgi:vancomycin permeability regulator SanA